MPKNKSSSSENRPASDQIRQELRRMENRSRFGSVMRNTLAVLLSVAAIAVLVATFLLPVMRVYSNAMKPTIGENEIVVAIKTKNPQRGDVVAFYYNNRILVRRIIGMPGDLVTVDQFGNVEVNSKRYVEPYVFQRSVGTADVEFPVLVPDDGWFVMGDNRLESVDSRNSVIGCVSEEELIGKILFCVWPFDSVRMFK